MLPCDDTRACLQLVVCDVIKQLGKKSLGSVWMHSFGLMSTAVKWITLKDDPGWDKGRGGYSRDQKLAMLLREIQSMKQLNHPNIVGMLGVTMLNVTSEEGQLQAALKKKQEKKVRVLTWVQADYPMAAATKRYPSRHCVAVAPARTQPQAQKHSGV